MKKLAIVFAVGAAALLGSSAANAADNTVKAKAATDATQSSTDFSSRRYHRHYRHYGYRHYRHYGYRHYRPHYRSYSYAPRPYYSGYGGGYGGPYYGGGYGRPSYGGGYGYGPSVTFGYGGGGYRGW